MFDIGMQELIIIFIVALLVFGPKRLPELAKTLGKGLGELKKALQDVKESAGEEFKETASDIREAVTDVKKQIESEVKDTGSTLDSTLQEVKEQVETESEELQKTLDDTRKDIEKQTGSEETHKTSIGDLKDNKGSTIDEKTDDNQHTTDNKPV